MTERHGRGLYPAICLYRQRISVSARIAKDLAVLTAIEASLAAPGVSA